MNLYTITILAFAVLLLLIDIWAFVDLFRSVNSNKFWWTLVILFLPAIGAISFFQITSKAKKQ